MHTVPPPRPRMGFRCPPQPLFPPAESAVLEGISFTGVRQLRPGACAAAGTPSSSSSAEMMWLTPDWVSPSSSPAPVREPSHGFFKYFVFFVSIRQFPSCIFLGDSRIISTIHFIL